MKTLAEMWEVNVGNIGKVYGGVNEKIARRDYEEYRRQSESGVGRCANESVQLIKDGEIIEETAGGEACDECGNTIPEKSGGGMENKYHAESCSLYNADKE